MQNWHNVRIGGRLRVVPENGSMWALLTTESFTPHLEFDFLGIDAPELAGYPSDRWEALPPGRHPFSVRQGQPTSFRLSPQIGP
jgi:hypothetical protein